MNLIAVNFDTQPSAHTDLLDYNITDEAMLTRLKTARSNIEQHVQALFPEENLSARDITQRLRFVSDLRSKFLYLMPVITSEMKNLKNTITTKYRFT